VTEREIIGKLLAWRTAEARYERTLKQPANGVSHAACEASSYAERAALDSIRDLASERDRYREALQSAMFRVGGIAASFGQGRLSIEEIQELATMVADALDPALAAREEPKDDD
jgi:hypothetical protein